MMCIFEGYIVVQYKMKTQFQCEFSLSLSVSQW